MPLLNFTTEVASTRTISQIVDKLAASGARQILIDYAASRPVGVAFSLDTPTGVGQYRLPVDPTAVEKVLRRQNVAPRYKSAAQAERVAWRIMKDWVEAQLAIIETQMVTADEVFLPYMVIGGQTVYQHYLQRQLSIGPGDD